MFERFEAAIGPVRGAPGLPAIGTLDFTETAMASSNIVGGDRAAQRHSGRDVDTLGPSDSSDSGSDVQGAFELDVPGEMDVNAGARQPGLDSASTAAGTGERGAARIDEEAELGSDIAPDSVQSLDPGDVETRPLEGLDTDLSHLATDEDEPLESDTEADAAPPRRGH